MSHIRLNIISQAAIFSPFGSLRLLGEVSQLFGDMTIPSLMLVLGANLSSGPGSALVPPAAIIAVAFGRLVALPLLGTALIVGAQHFGMLVGLDATAIIVMLLMWAVPSALMLHSVATMLGNKPDEIASILFW